MRNQRTRESLPSTSPAFIRPPKSALHPLLGLLALLARIEGRKAGRIKHGNGKGREWGRRGRRRVCDEKEARARIARCWLQLLTITLTRFPHCGIVGFLSRDWWNFQGYHSRTPSAIFLYRMCRVIAFQRASITRARWVVFIRSRHRVSRNSQESRHLGE